MDHILPYEAINEASNSLPKMPEFLKKAGAKPQHVQYGGPRNPNQPPNAWSLEISSPTKTKSTWRIDFFPEGNFSTSIAPDGKTNMPYRSGGTWKVEPSSDFKIGGTTLKGVSMKFTTLMATTTYN